jgi:hypothetical protein
LRKDRFFGAENKKGMPFGSPPQLFFSKCFGTLCNPSGFYYYLFLLLLIEVSLNWYLSNQN